jgi:hypothetical protein
MTNTCRQKIGNLTPGSIGTAVLLPLLLLVSVLLPSPAGAVTCHCFKDRTFDPARPEKSEPYVLATTQNSFFAASFGIPRKAVVEAKMSGAGSPDLWVAYYSAPPLRRRAGELMAERRGSTSWAETLKGKGQVPGGFSPRFREAIDSGSSDGALASLAAAETLVLHLGTEWRELEALIAGGASTAEMVAASLLSRWTGRSPTALWEDVRKKGTTWGGLLHRLDLPPSEVEGAVRRLVP